MTVLRIVAGSLYITRVEADFKRVSLIDTWIDPFRKGLVRLYEELDTLFRPPHGNKNYIFLAVE